MDLLGWYCTGVEPTENEVQLQQQFLGIHESPLCLQLNPASRTTDLPVAIYESFWDMAGAEEEGKSAILAAAEAAAVALEQVAPVRIYCSILRVWSFQYFSFPRTLTKAWRTKTRAAARPPQLLPPLVPACSW